MSMKKTICVINGKGGVGKDTLIESIAKLDNTFVYNCSSIEPFRNLCAQFNKSGNKDLEYRKFLADMKYLVDDYCEKTNFISCSQEYLNEELKKFMLACDKLEERNKENSDVTKTDYAVMFVHIREPYNICEFIDRTKRELGTMKDADTIVTTLLIESNRAKEHYGNKSDDMVDRYVYDFTYTSNGSIKEDAKAFDEFFFGILEYAAYEFYDNVIYDHDRDDFIVGKTYTGEELHAQYHESTHNTMLGKGQHRTFSDVSVPVPYAIGEKGQIGVYMEQEIRDKIIDSALELYPKLKNKKEKERE